MPNNSVDKISQELLACYPRRTFYPLSDGPSTRNHRITMADFRLCLTCTSYSQANLYHYALQTVSNRLEFTFARLRYSLGGDRPSQTTHHTLSSIADDTIAVRRHPPPEWCFIVSSSRASAQHSSPPTYATQSLERHQYKAIVKVHGVFPSYRRYPASSRGIQFHGACAGDSREVVTPFVRVGTYPTRNFATLGPL